MTKFYLTLSRLVRDNRGQDLVEYALLASLVALSAAVMLPDLSTSISTLFSRLGSVVTNGAA